MQLLDAVNLVMQKLGERPVTTVNAQHPTLAVLLPVIEQTRRTALMRGWWFNEYSMTLYPDLAGNIALGADVLSFVPDCEGSAIVRGDKLYNPDTLTYVFSGPVAGRVTQDVVFDELPEAAAVFVLYTAAVEAYATDLGVTQELSLWQNRAQQGWSDLIAEHLRQRRHSTRKSQRWGRLLSAMRS